MPPGKSTHSTNRHSSRSRSFQQPLAQFRHCLVVFQRRLVALPVPRPRVLPLPLLALNPRVAAGEAPDPRGPAETVAANVNHVTTSHSFAAKADFRPSRKNAWSLYGSASWLSHDSIRSNSSPRFRATISQILSFILP